MQNYLYFGDSALLLEFVALEFGAEAVKCQNAGKFRVACPSIQKYGVHPIVGIQHCRVVFLLFICPI